MSSFAGGVQRSRLAVQAQSSFQRLLCVGVLGLHVHRCKYASTANHSCPQSRGSGNITKPNDVSSILDQDLQGRRYDGENDRHLITMSTTKKVSKDHRMRNKPCLVAKAQSYEHTVRGHVAG